jgi:hypothetical protein
MAKKQIIDNLLNRFPDADPNQLCRFVNSRWDGDVSADDMELIAEAWTQANYCGDGRLEGA